MYAVVFHTHQKIDKAAHKQLLDLLPESSSFPNIKQILNFEGNHGPDSAKLKRSQTSEQPWHFIDPQNTKLSELEKQISNHRLQLIKHLKNNDFVGAAFEAAWYAHALVDGLTPAHHFPYEDALKKLSVENVNSRNGIVGRAFIKGENVYETVLKSLKLVGPKGIITSHAMFEGGAYVIIAPLKLNKLNPQQKDMMLVKSKGIITLFRQNLKTVAELDLYNRFCRLGWTRPIAKDVKFKLAPTMVSMVSLAWYEAAISAKSKI